MQKIIITKTYLAIGIFITCICILFSCSKQSEKKSKNNKIEYTVDSDVKGQVCPWIFFCEQKTIFYFLADDGKLYPEPFLPDWYGEYFEFKEYEKPEDVVWPLNTVVGTCWLQLKPTGRQAYKSAFGPTVFDEEQNKIDAEHIVFECSKILNPP
jgi:hypothetical protein